MTWQTAAQDVAVIDPTTQERSELDAVRMPPWGRPPEAACAPGLSNTHTWYVRVRFLVEWKSEPSWQDVLRAAHAAGAFEFLSHPEEDAWDEEA